MALLLLVCILLHLLLPLLLFLVLYWDFLLLPLLLVHGLGTKEGVKKLVLVLLLNCYKMSLHLTETLVTSEYLHNNPNHNHHPQQQKQLQQLHLVKHQHHHLKKVVRGGGDTGE